VCRVKGPERDRLLALCQEQHTPGWFQQHGSRLPKQLVTLIDHGNKAVAISDFEATGVPGLLQTGEYARAVISRVVNVPANEVDDRVAARLARRACRHGRAFRLMEFADFKPVVYWESETSSLFLEKPEEIQAYRHILGALADTALGEGQSRELIATLATELYADREDHHDRN
jgi:hypothetical protein